MLKISERISPKASLDAVLKELAEIQEKLNALIPVTESVEVVVNENKEFEARLVDAKRMMYSLVHEKLRAEMIFGIEEYSKKLNDDVTVLIKKPEEKK